MRLIDVLTNGNRQVKIYRNTEYDEYICKLFIFGIHYKKSDYHTDNKIDAVQTAAKMCNS